jgi:hypothetical protein
MPGLKNRFMDEVIRIIRRYMRLEICAVDKINWHESPADHKLNPVDVIMRDRSLKDSKNPIRKQLPVLQNLLGGHCGGYNWNPRVGDLVWVFFYGGRQGLVLANAWSWAEYPICRPSPYDIADKNGQWMEPGRDGFGDFTKQPYPELKKPYCFRWFHGPIKGSTGPGRDWCWLFDYCQMGHGTPSCKDCKTLDSIQRLKNQYFKFYSEETESRKGYPYRAEFHAHCGSYWLFESTDRPTSEYISEVYTEGEGYWTIQGAKIENDLEVLKGHLRHSPTGTMELHSATPEAAEEDNAGHRVRVFSPDDTQADEHGPIAAELINLEKKALVRIYKDGSARIRASTDVTGQDAKSEVFLDVNGHCWLWNVVDDTYIEFFADGDCKIKAESITLDGDVGITGDTVITGSLTHGGGPCCNGNGFTEC